jgi:hypothetical protein
MRATWLADVIRDAGLTIKPLTGWEVRGKELDPVDGPNGVMLHHTVTAKSRSDSSVDYFLGITGRVDLAAPLCNYSTNRDGSVSIIAAGRANHGGAGSWKNVSGNANFIGDEMKNLGAGEAWPAVQLESAYRAAAAVMTQIGRGAEWVCGHKEYATPLGRKVDPHTLNMTDVRARVAILMGQGDDDMSLVARLMVVEAGSKTWLPDQAAIDYWMIRADNLDNPAYAAEWRRDFEQMWAVKTQEEWKKLQGHPHGAPVKGDKGDKGDPGLPGANGVTEDRVKQIIGATKLTP